MNKNRVETKQNWSQQKKPKNGMVNNLFEVQLCVSCAIVIDGVFLTIPKSGSIAKINKE